MANENKWEHWGDSTYRQSVPGGWLYRWGHYNPVPMVFVPDVNQFPLGTWDNPLNVYIPHA